MSSLTLEQKRALLMQKLQQNAATGKSDVSEAAAYLRDGRLDPEIKLNGPVPTTPMRTALVTGTTGYVSAFLMHQLARQGVQLYCLVRAADAAAGMQRIRASMARYELWNADFATQWKAVPGDLALPHMGLAKSLYDSLATEVDAIFHVGAHVNFGLPYEALRATNVTGVHDIIRFSVRGKTKPLHFVSSLGMFLARAYGGKFVDADTRADPLLSSTGYGATKAVAEQLLLAARERGLPVTLHRAGFVAWDTQSGFYNEADLACQILLGCVQVGAAPAVEFTFNTIVPVDYCVQTIIHLARQPFGSVPAVVHLANPLVVDFRTVLEQLDRLGWRVRAQPYSQWRQTLSEAKNNVLTPMVPLMPEQGHMIKEFLPTYGHYSAPGAPVCPPLNSELFLPFVQRLQKRGLLPT